MSASAAPGSHWQRPDLVASFLEGRDRLIPMLGAMEDIVLRLLARSPRPVERFIDLGAGAGAMTRLVLRAHPDAEGTLVDNSQPMLDAVATTLPEGARWRAVRADLSQAGWRGALPDDGGPYDAVVSAFAIHHLPGDAKRALYRDAAELLAPGGLFVNMDYVLVTGLLAGLWDEEMVANAVRHDHDHGAGRSKEEIEGEIFDDDADDRPDTAEDQVTWLAAAGLEQAEIQFKWAEGAVLAALKPPRP